MPDAVATTSERAFKSATPPRSSQLEPKPPIKAGVIYTCPMHRQIRQEGPGNCPICGPKHRMVARP